MYCTFHLKKSNFSNWSTLQKSKNIKTQTINYWNKYKYCMSNRWCGYQRRNKLGEIPVARDSTKTIDESN